MKNLPKVCNLTSASGNTVANQFIIDLKDKCVFQSYKSIIAVINTKNGKITLDKHYWNYSKTMSKYRALFLGETTKETKVKIEAGVYKLADLN